MRGTAKHSGWLVAAIAPAVVAFAAIATASPVRYTTTSRQVSVAIATAPLWAAATWLTVRNVRSKPRAVRCLALAGSYLACLAAFRLRVVDQEGFGGIDLMALPALACVFEVVVANYAGDRSQSVDSPSAGWFADPRARFESRYWDGQRWTADVSNQGILTKDPDGI